MTVTTVADEGESANVADANQDEIVTELNRDVNVADGDKGVILINVNLNQGVTVMDGVDQARLWLKKLVL